jgi:hypothetical protein
MLKAPSFACESMYRLFFSPQVTLVAVGLTVAAGCVGAIVYWKKTKRKKVSSIF